MAGFFSILSMHAAPELREEAIAKFISTGIFELCRAEIPGFVNAMLLKSLEQDAAACVLVEWRDEQAYEDWMNSPIRASESLVGSQLFDPPGRSQLFQVVHQVGRQQ